MTDSPAPDSAAAIIDLLIDRKLLTEVGLSPNHARTMKARNRIPGEWNEAIVGVCARHGLPVDYALLAKIAARRRGAQRAEKPSQLQTLAR